MIEPALALIVRVPLVQSMPLTVALPVPPLAVFTVIETAPAVAFVVVIVRLLAWVYPSAPAPSVLAAMVTVPEPPAMLCWRLIALMLVRLTLPDVVVICDAVAPMTRSPLPGFASVMLPVLLVRAVFARTERPPAALVIEMP